MKTNAIKRVLSLRAMEKERAETELAQQRRLLEMCRDSVHGSLQRDAEARAAMSCALADADSASVLTAAMAMTFGPLQRQRLRRRLAEIERCVSAAAAEWHAARQRHLQMQTIATAADARARCEAQKKEQKSLDDWFLSTQTRIGAGVCGKDKDFASKMSFHTDEDGLVVARRVVR